MRQQTAASPLPYPRGIVRCKEPKRSFHRGRTWDAWDAVLPRGYRALAHLDTSWGTHFYFRCPVDGLWRKGAILDFEVGTTFDLREERYGLQIGQAVKLKPGLAVAQPYHDPGMPARIVAFYDDIDGGLRLDRELGGFVSWNIADVDPVRDNTIRPSRERIW